MGKKRLIFLTNLLIITIIQMVAQPSDSKQYHQLSDYPFVIVSEEAVTTPPEISDSLFDAAARGIRFRVNSSELQSSDPFIPLYRSQLVPWLKSQDMELRQVFVKGAASPDGPYENNVRLSRERTRRLIELLNTELGVDGNDGETAQPVSEKSITEDYQQLVRLMRQAGDPDCERVNAVWLDCQGDEACCKQKLKSLDGGRLWRRMAQTYFPKLRQARVILWFAKKMPIKKGYSPKPDTIPPAPPMVQMPPTDTVAFALQEQPDTLRPVAYTRRHLIAVRTNLLHDLLYVPQFGFAWGGNIQLEYYPKRGHYTYNAGFTFSNHRHWSDYKFFQIRDLQLELRRYFRGEGAFIGPYLGVYAEGTKYGIGFSKTKGWQGEGGGGGISAGWTWPLTRNGNLRLEASISLGVFYTRYDPYVYGNPMTSAEDGLYYYDYHGNTSEFEERNHRFTWLGPTNAGVHITYDIIYRKKQRIETN